MGLRTARSTAWAFVRSLPARVLLFGRVLLAVATLPSEVVLAALRLPRQQLAATLLSALNGKLPKTEELPPPREESVLAVDVGASRTKFLLVNASGCVRLDPLPTADIWQDVGLEGEDKFEPSAAPPRVKAYLAARGIDASRIGRFAFSVPGTTSIDPDRLDGYLSDNVSVIKNTPSMSPRFRGFDFKEAFREVAPAAKVSAVADNLAAALGVACQNPSLRSALVLVLGTAPAVATIFRDPSGKGKYIETAIWQVRDRGYTWSLGEPFFYLHGGHSAAVVGLVLQDQARRPARLLRRAARHGGRRAAAAEDSCEDPAPSGADPVCLGRRDLEAAARRERRAPARAPGAPERGRGVGCVVRAAAVGGRRAGRALPLCLRPGAGGARARRQRAAVRRPRDGGAVRHPRLVASDCAAGAGAYPAR